MRKYPAIIECLKHRHEMYNAQLDYVEAEAKAGRILLIAPPCNLPIGRIEMKPEKLKFVHNIGLETAEQMKQQILDYIH